jgi:hypothetical protein
VAGARCISALLECWLPHLADTALAQWLMWEQPAHAMLMLAGETSMRYTGGSTYE